MDLNFKMRKTPLDVVGFQFSVVTSKALLFHERLNVRVGLPAE